jgi:uncharacterized protein YbcV (DUF1398 family)
MNCKRKKCKGELYFIGYASMGGSHSNYYKCDECKAIYEIYDRDINNSKEYIFCGFSKK